MGRCKGQEITVRVVTQGQTPSCFFSPALAWTPPPSLGSSAPERQSPWPLECLERGKANTGPVQLCFVV